MGLLTPYHGVFIMRNCVQQFQLLHLNGVKTLSPVIKRIHKLCPYLLKWPLTRQLYLTSP